MRNVGEVKRFSVYLSFALRDRGYAEELQRFLVQAGLNIQCDLKPQHAPDHARTRLWATQSIRSCDLFVLLLSQHSVSPLGRLLKPLLYDSAEAKSFHRRRILLYLRKIRAFPRPFVQNNLLAATKTYTVEPEANKDGINYDRLSQVLREVGYPLVQEGQPSGGSDEPPPVGEGYDVFISCKSEDYEHAKVVYDFLVSRGVTVFLSKASLPQMGKDEYRDRIDLAIEESRHMLVVASKAAHVKAEWVKYEWGLFLGEKLAGRKEGNLVTVLAGGIKVSELPISLRNRETVPLVPEEIGRLLNYLS